MANHKSAKKRAKQNEKKRLRNKVIRTTMKTAIKNVRQAVESKSEDILNILNNAISVIDKSAKKGIIHRNTASRNKSRLTKLVVNARS
ncbi:MAG: 30S ribosomal protein S20 [Desulfobacteraceae bacterium 4572_19]|nr:MAG: 30S ribosomal protein S20 [Desulfobacteraceae bacterium 4572_19]